MIMNKGWNLSFRDRQSRPKAGFDWRSNCAL